MIVETMTLDEIAKEMHKDDACMKHRLKEALEKETKKPFFRQLTEFPFYFVRETESNRKNKYLMRIKLASKKSVKKHEDVTFDNFALYNRPGKGYYLYGYLGENIRKIAEYTPHFFHRYAERTGFEGTPIEVIRHYLRHSPSVMRTTATLDDVTYLAVANNEGMAFGTLDNGNFRVKTFVLYDTLFRDQKQFRNTLIEVHLVYDRWKSGVKDEANDKRIIEMAKTIEADCDKACQVMWQSYARFSLGKDVKVLSLGAGKYELWERKIHILGKIDLPAGKN